MSPVWTGYYSAASSLEAIWLTNGWTRSALLSSEHIVERVDWIVGQSSIARTVSIATRGRATLVLCSRHVDMQFLSSFRRLVGAAITSLMQVAASCGRQLIGGVWTEERDPQ